MPKFPLSPDQQSIVDSRKQNILVSAAAGSGKTRVLTERIVGRVCDATDPIDIDRILVVTFTNSAAREMKDRISAALSERIAANPSDSHLEKQATLIHNAQITTIDSFCLWLFRNNFHRINADPSLRVMNEGEKELLMNETMEDVIKRAYESGDKDFHHIVDCYSKKDKDDSLESSIRKLFNYAMSYPWPVKWLEDRRKDYSFENFDDFRTSKVVAGAFDSAAESLENAEMLCNRALSLCDEPGGPSEYKKTLSADLDILSALREKVLKKEDFDSLCLLISATEFPRIANAGKDTDPILKQQVQDYRKKYKAMVTDIGDRIFYDPLENIYKDMSGAAGNVNKLLDLTVDFARSFAMAKEDRGVMDFSDMEHMAVNILIKDYRDDGTYEITDVAKTYRDFFEEVMVDEYQDSNLVQELIIQSISREKEGEPNRFMVGDVKQSIYSFRMARPQIFMGKLRDYSKAADAKNRLITLKNNYRSRDGVINSVNALFGTVMSEKKGGVPYDDDAKLYKGGSFTEDTDDNITEVIMLASDERSDKNRDAEARMIAAKIKDMVGRFKVTDSDSKELRPAGYGDIALLFRSPTKWAPCISAAFEEAGIPYHMEGVGDFYEATEVRDVLSFLEVLDNPLSDISLYAAMTSFFGKFTDEECALIKVKAREGYYFWEKLEDYSKNNPGDLKVEAFLTMVDRYRKMVTYVPIDELLTALYDETGYRHVVAALPGGKQRLANINMLLSKAAEYGATSFYGLFHFLRYVELIKKTDREEGEAGVFDEHSDAVRVMSIHKSKGLEFPVCIVGAISERFNDSDSRTAFVANVDAGLGAYFIDPVKRIKKHTLQQSLVADRIRRESLGEEIRILYVAMTRAKEKLIMTGVNSDPEAWIAAGGSEKESSYADLMAEAVARYKGIYFKFTAASLTDIEQAGITDEVDNASKLTTLRSDALCDEAILEKLRERFSFKYSKDYLSRLYIKTTVSKLKLAAMEEDFESHMPFEEKETGEYIPRFAAEKEEIKGTDRGTAYHNLLQLLDFAAFTDCREQSDYTSVLNSQIESLKASEKMSEDALSKISLNKIVSFLKTDIAKEMGAAAKEKKLYKEQPFVMGVKASEVEEDFPDTETILVQGVIDVYYVKGESAVVLDYKTDRVTAAEELVKRYKTQLDYYGRAISQLTGLKIKEKLIYSFALNEILRVE
ncbi:MAG: helicase-exonuclease AddAB subunit AddA [Lachnospiraceae bacterium]|nr:helicase-exonuclease AddAB subunit AddA [Lachnospiraceae bacterium]